MTFGEKLKSLRKERGLTAKQLAKKSGLTAVSISNYENGHRKPNLVGISKLASALECDFDELYELAKD